MKKIDISMVIISLLASVILTGMVSATDIASPARVTAIESPQIQFDNTSTGDDQEWIIFADELSFDIFDGVGDNDVFRRVLGITPSINSLNSFIVDSSGDINFANGSIFIDKSDNKMGIGTTTPEGDLHIAGTGMMIFDHSGSKWKVGIDTPVDSNKPVPPFPILNSFQIHDLGSGKTPFRIYKNAPDNSFIINPAGKLNTVNALTTRWKGTGASGLAELLKISAHNDDIGQQSDAGFVMENTRAGFSWAFRTQENTGGFAASKQGTGAKEFEVRNTTSVASNVELHLASGARNINGQWLNASSRSYKDNITPLSSQDAMQALKELESVTYHFKRDPNKESLVGFIAEDVPALLATRNKKTVDSLQIVAVLTKVVQEQGKSLQAKAQKIKAMEAKITQLELLQERLVRMEALLPQLIANKSNSLKVMY